MEQHTTEQIAEQVGTGAPAIPAVPAKPSVTIPLDRESALVGFCALLLIALAFETYQLVRIRQVIASGSVAAATTSAAAAPATSAGLENLPTMSGGC